MKRGALVLACVMGATIGLPSEATPAGAADAQVLRIATLLPRSRESLRDLKKWNAQLASSTGGRLKVRMYWGGVAGDEVTVLRKMKAGDYDEGSHVLRAKVTSLEFRVQGIVCIAKFPLLCCVALRG